MPQACTFHLVRHGEHTLPPGILAGRTPGVGLSPLGVAQAHALGRHLTTSGAHMLVCSPLQRTHETAAPIAAALGLTPTADPALIEIDFGLWTGQRIAGLAHDPAWTAWNAVRGLAATPAGDTMLAVQSRAMATLTRLRDAGGAVIVVSHADVIKAILAYALGMPLDLIHRLEVSLASRSVLVLGASFAEVSAINLPV